MQNFSLNCINVICGKEETIKNCIVLFHGYGGDGKDISMLSLNWKRHLPNTIFICPNGHEKCSINPSGFQWFDLTKDDPKYILDISSTGDVNLQGGNGSTQGDTKIAINQLTRASDITRITRDIAGLQPGDGGYAGGMLFTHNGKVHQITNYESDLYNFYNLCL